MKALGIIPSRYQSSRLPGKPLADIMGKPMIQHVYERASEAFECLVATDDQRIFEAVQAFGGQVIMTSSAHTTGTNRCLEAYEKYSAEKKASYDVVVNIQGDEPLIQAAQLRELLHCFTHPGTALATLAIEVREAKELYGDSDCFLVLDDQQNALYFSRAVIPPVRGVPKENWIEHHTYYRHLGLYGYTPEALTRFARMEQSSLEKAESLEQNRWLQSGRKIKVGITAYESISVDTAEDLEKARMLFKEKKGA